MTSYFYEKLSCKYNGIKNGCEYKKHKGVLKLITTNQNIYKVQE